MWALLGSLKDPKSRIGTMNRWRFGGRGSVLKPASPLALLIAAPPQKREGTGALQDLAASRRFIGRSCHTESALTIGKRTSPVNSNRHFNRKRVHSLRFFGIPISRKACRSKSLAQGWICSLKKRWDEALRLLVIESGRPVPGIGLPNRVQVGELRSSLNCC